MNRKYIYQSTSTYDLDMEPRIQKNSIHGVPFYVGILVIIGLVGLLGAAYYFDSILPTPLTLKDAKLYPDSYITERAALDLKDITDFGPKITGSYENEYFMVDYLTKKIESIIYEAHSSQLIELDVQVVSGGYFLSGAGGVINVYDRIQNVIVKLHSKNITEHSILVNSHFDSVPTSPGGMDDGINVASMLEIIHIMSKNQEQPLHNIIFLFNGAEETPLQAAHGFIAHKWAKDCKILLNLESSGHGGKIILFQTGPETPWLVKYYNKVPHPYGTVTGEEIFQSGVIPSDTDFRVFRDFGGLVGVDMAFFKNGYRYHTKFDDFENIPLGSYQHVGDNALSLVKNLANAPEVLEKEHSKGKAVYYDFFGLFFIHYTSFVGHIVNILTIVLSVGIFGYSLWSFRLGFSKSTFKYVLTTAGAILLSWILSGTFVYALATILDLLNKTMSWYANPWIILGLYMVPTIGLSGSLMAICNHKNLSLGIRSQIQCHVVRFIWTVCLTVGVLLNIRSVYVLMIPVLFNSLGFIVIHIFKWQHSVRKWQIVYLFSLLIPTLMLIYAVFLLFAMFIPITGRMGAHANPEVLIGVMSLFPTLLVTSPLTVLTNLLHQAKYYFITLGGIFLIFFVIVFTPLGFPYSGDLSTPRPQRHWIMHTSREFYNDAGVLTKTDSGFFMLNMDRNSPSILKNYVRELSDAKSVEEDCQKYPLCAFPLTHAKVVKRIQYSTWIPTNQPVFAENETLKFSVVSKEHLSPTRIKYNVETSGPDKLVFYFIPRPNTTLISISLIDQSQLHPISVEFDGRPIYMLLYQLGKSNGTVLSFDFTVERPENHKGSSMDISVTGRYVHEKRMTKTVEYQRLLTQMPEWTDVTAWLAAYKSYVV